MSDLIGKSLGRYHILEQLGEGGMATVYKAYDIRLEADVALKFIRTDNLPQNAVQRALKRFEREAKALAKLTHPNIVKVSDYGEFENKPYLVMPYLPGGTLKQLLGNPLPWRQAIQLLGPIAEALDYAHSQGMVHRDVKPSNILLTERGQPMLTDFGIAKVLDLEETVDLTGTSMAVGTPDYMAPEQATAKTVDHRADIYSLGIVLYEMVTGRKPFIADTPMAILFKHASDPLPRPTAYVRSLPDKLEKVLIKALAKKPEDRYQNASEFSEALTRIDLDVQNQSFPSWIKGASIASGIILAVLVSISIFWYLAKQIISWRDTPNSNSVQTLSSPIETQNTIIPSEIPEAISLSTLEISSPTTIPTEENVSVPSPFSEIVPEDIFLRPSCGKSYSVEANTPINVIYGGWGANGADLIKDNTKHLQVDLFIDGSLVNGFEQPIMTMSAVPCGDFVPNSFWVFHSAQLELSPGRHTVVVILTFHVQITDGYDLDNNGILDAYGPGQLTPAEFIIQAE